MIKAAHEASRKRYENPRVHGERRLIGVRSSADKVARLLREEGLAGRSRLRFIRTTVRDASRKPDENVLNREFSLASRTKDG